LGKYENGLYGLSTGQNVNTIMINEDLFEQAGVPLPDDTSWTWEDYYRISTELSQKLDGVAGTDYGNSADTHLRIWLRQNDESLYNEAEPGKVGYSNETAASWFEHLLRIRDNGGPSAAQFVEDISGTFESQSFPTRLSAMGWYWSNQLALLGTATGDKITMMRAPSPTGDPQDNGMYYKSSMYWSISAQSDEQEAAAKFVNYLANDAEAAKILLVDRGVPANPDMVEAITPELGEADQAVVEFLQEIRPEMAESPQPAPVGGGAVEQIIIRYMSDVLFDNISPQEAAERMTDEIESAIKAG
jgi:multiple sugar transport system substrate-binding protein